MAGREDHVDIDIVEALMSIEHQLRDCLPGNEHNDFPSIYRVPPSVSAGRESAYHPQIISIGPYHHGAPALQAMEPLKRRYLNDLISRSPDNNKLEKYVGVVTSLEPSTRSCYSEGVELGRRKEFVEMIVFDGCFIIEFLIKWRLKTDNNRIGSAKWNLPLLQNDLLLLENQIPFLVLRVLFRESEVPQLDASTTLLELAADYIAPDMLSSLLETTPLHLLHLFYLSYKPTTNSRKPSACARMVARIFRGAKSVFTASIFCLLSFVLSCQIRSTCCRHPLDEEGKAPVRAIRSATELKESGVTFKRRRESSCFLEVMFDKDAGIMEIPKLSIDLATSSWFRNLLAFEQSSPAAGTYFASYATLLGNLIDTPADVILLKKYDILETNISGEDVTAFFNQICKAGYLDYDKHYFGQLFRDVKKYCEDDRHRWRAKLVRDHFGNPWAKISFIAAFILLALTILQATFHLLRYYHPKH